VTDTVSVSKFPEKVGKKLIRKKPRFRVHTS